VIIQKKTKKIQNENNQSIKQIQILSMQSNRTLWRAVCDEECSVGLTAEESGDGIRGLLLRVDLKEAAQKDERQQNAESEGKFE
jgi:hypothetical protein